jgi:hypothetical protein
MGRGEGFSLKSEDQQRSGEPNSAPPLFGVATAFA